MASLTADMTVNVTVDTSRLRRLIDEAGGVEAAAERYATARDNSSYSAFKAGAEWLLPLVEKSFHAETTPNPAPVVVRTAALPRWKPRIDVPAPRDEE